MTKPSWLAIAEVEMLAGVVEVAGSGDNPRIVEYHRTTTLPDHLAAEDETAWCSSFVNFCVQRAGYQGTRSARARSWLRWGVGVSIVEPPLGAIAVMKRGGANQPGPEVIDAQGHVGFFVGFPEPGRVAFLGGNQSNAVNVSTYPAERLLGFRWLS